MQSTSYKQIRILSTNIAEKSSLFTFCYKFLFVLLVLRLLVFHTVFELSNMAELAFTAATAVVAVIGVVSIFPRLKQSTKFLSITTMILLFVSYIIHFSGLEYMCNIVTFASLLIMTPFIRVNKKRVIGFFIFFLAFVIFLFFTAPNSAEFDANHEGMNPNNSAIACFLVEFLALSLFSKSQKRGWKICLLLITALVFVFQLNFGGRSSLIGTFLMILYFLFEKKFNHLPPKLIKILAFLIVVCGVLFAYFYSVTLFEAVGKGNVVIFGKDIFTGRQVIWSEAFKSIGSNWLFGIGNEFESSWTVATSSATTELANNLHNFSLGFVTIFGVLPFLSFVFLVISSLNFYFSYRSKHFLIVILIMFISCYFETYLYSSYSTYFIFPLLILIGSTDKMIYLKSVKVENV